MNRVVVETISTATISAKVNGLKKEQAKFHNRDRRWQNLLPLVRCRFCTVFLSSVGIGVLVNLIRFLTFLQPLELGSLDLLMQIRPTEEPDPRLLIIEVTAEDYEREKIDGRIQEAGMSISDRSLIDLINNRSHALTGLGFVPQSNLLG